jgi:hypothetical protein
LSDAPSAIGVILAGTRITAMSVSGSVPTSVAFRRSPPGSVTMISVASATTWSFVMM